MQSVTTSQDGEVLVLSVNNPPVNALSWHVRQGISDGIEQGLTDDSVKAIVIRCEGQTFIAGADITEFGKAPQGPDFNAVLNTIETATKPVIDKWTPQIGADLVKKAQAAVAATRGK